ncbi:MAG: SpoIIE family protein phosphatase [Ignavibacteriales bacterium]|nr:SpoIIE family protein phosphatase [Ignavibacteriales bacterium]
MKNISRSRGLENAILLSILLFLFNMIFPLHDTNVLAIINELLVFLSVFFLYHYVHQFLNTKVDSPLTLILNAGILAALIFFIVSIANSILGSADNSRGIGFFNSLFSVLLAFVFIGSIVYIFSTFRELFFLRQKRDLSTFFNTMLVFFALTFFSNILVLFDPSFDYPQSAFYVVTIVLICLNSTRVSWIAFLTKKQKYYLLIISVILSTLFGINFATFINNSIMRQIVYTFSPGLHTLMSLVMIYGTINFGIIFFTTLFHLPTAEAFDRKAEEVSSLMDLTNLITQVFDFKELAETITTITTRVCNSDSAWLVLKSAANIELSSVHNIGYVDADKITNNLLGSGENDYDSIGIIQYDSIISNTNEGGQIFKSIAIAPLKVQKKINGYLFAARHRENNFDRDEKKAVQAFADYAAVALENAKLFEESIEKERLEKELDVARDIQKKILPSTVPTSNRLEISALFVPAFEVGGDYYDFFELSDDLLGFVVADVSGKGISSAFIMAEVKGIFESLSKIITNPKELLIRVNDTLKRSLDKRNFVTAIYGIINKKNGILNFARAGHTPILLCSGERIESIQPPGIGLGLDYNPRFASSLKETEIQLKNNDIIICYSDGITEAKNHKEEDFGYERLDTIVLNNRGKSLDLISNAVMKELSLFSKNHSQHDDITLVIFKWNQNN